MDIEDCHCVHDLIWGEIWDLLSRVGYDNPCMSFVYSSVLLLVVFLALCIFVAGRVAYVYMCRFIVNWAKLSFLFMC